MNFFTINETSEDNIDAKANLYALRCFCITMAAFFVAWVLNQLNIFIVDKHIMTTGLCLAAGLFVMCLVICSAFGLHGKDTKYLLLFFIIAITTVIEIMLTYHAVILSVIPIVYSSMYHDTKKMTLYTYALTIISIFAIVYVGYFVGLCDANMALLTSAPLAEYTLPGNVFALSEINPNPMLTLFVYFVFPRCVICGVFVPICVNISRIITQSRDKEEAMRSLAEIDGMTGLYNKTKFLETVSNPYAAEEQVAVIYWDVNGLKETNDTIGHELGDRLIVSVAKSIRDISSDSAHAFRVGGDEFVMILRGVDEDTVDGMVGRWRETTRDLKVGGNIPVSVAVGYACGSGADIESVIRRADEQMYIDKREHYRHMH